MSGQDDDKNVSRRSLLKKSAAGASAGLAGISQPVMAKRETEKDELEKLGTMPEVRSILADLGYDEIPTHESAVTVEIEINDGKLTVVSVDFGYGSLQVGDLNGKTSAAFNFSDKMRPSVPGAGKAKGNGVSRGRGEKNGHLSVPEKYSDIPAESDAWILGSETGTRFVRTATESERKEVLSSVSVRDGENTLVYTRSDIDGFRVDVMNPEVNELRGEVSVQVADEPDESDGGMLRYEVPAASSGSITSMSAGFVSASGGVEAQWISNPAKKVATEMAKELGFAGLDYVQDHCGWAIGGCVTGISGSISGCLKCAPACAGSVTGVGAVVCFLCVFGVCSHLLTGISCAQAVGCVENKY